MENDLRWTINYHQTRHTTQYTTTVQKRHRYMTTYSGHKMNPEMHERSVSGYQMIINSWKMTKNRQNEWIETKNDTRQSRNPSVLIWDLFFSYALEKRKILRTEQWKSIIFLHSHISQPAVNSMKENYPILSTFQETSEDISVTIVSWWCYWSENTSPATLDPEQSFFCFPAATITSAYASPRGSHF